MSIATQNQWNNAIAALEAKNIAVAENVIECCRGCVDGDVAFGHELDTDAAYAWTFAGQDQGYVWHEGIAREAVNTFEEEGGYTENLKVSNVAMGPVYFNHGGGAAEAIMEVFQAHGFKVEWDGGEHSTVIVFPNEQSA